MNVFKYMPFGESKICRTSLTKMILDGGVERSNYRNSIYGRKYSGKTQTNS